MEDMDRELDRYYQNSDSYEDDQPAKQTVFQSGTRLTAIQPKWAENNPVNLIMGNGDSFVIPDGTTLKPATADLLTPPARSDLGLGADPLASKNLGLDDYGSQTKISLDKPNENPNLYPDNQNQGSLQQAVQPGPKPPLRSGSSGFFSKNQKMLLLIISIVAALVVIGTFVLSLGQGPSDQLSAPTPVASQSEVSPESPDAPTVSGSLPAEEEETIKISFPEGSTFHYLDNVEAGQLLVLTGSVKNDEEKAISFIRLKAKLTDSSDKVLAERQIFAGNLLTEDEIKALSMKEILSRLSLKGGQNGLNTNVTKGKSIPYMFVFDKLPSDVARFVVEPVGYTDASTTSLGN
jgi:hypothetical protein